VAKLIDSRTVIEGSLCRVLPIKYLWCIYSGMGDVSGMTSVQSFRQDSVSHRVLGSGSKGSDAPFRVLNFALRPGCQQGEKLRWKLVHSPFLSLFSCASPKTASGAPNFTVFVWLPARTGASDPLLPDPST